QDAGARDREFAHHGIEFAPVADRAAEPAILPEIVRRMRHHPENIGVAILAQHFAGAVVGFGGIAVVDTGHGSSLLAFGLFQAALCNGAPRDSIGRPAVEQLPASPRESARQRRVWRLPWRFARSV